jgi:hypothetical protein
VSRVPIGLLVGALAVGACNSLTGAGDLQVGPGDTTSGADGGGSVPVPVPIPGDGGGVVLPSCGAARVCVPTGGGWTPAATPRTTSAACPAGYPTSADLTAQKVGTDKCTCTCSALGGAQSACPAKVSVATGGASCNMNPTTDITFPADGGCVPGDAGIGFVRFTAATASGTNPTCDPTMQPSFTQPSTSRVCTGAASTSDGCAADEACVPAALPGKNCVLHDGDVACPPSWQKTLVGSGVQNDGRTCTGCTCAVDTDCSQGKLTGFSSATCGMFGSPITLGACTLPIASGLTFVPSNGCKVNAQPQVTGSITLASPQTLCCTSAP